MADHAVGNRDGLHEVQDQQDNDDADGKKHVLLDDPFHLTGQADRINDAGQVIFHQDDIGCFLEAFTSG